MVEYGIDPMAAIQAATVQAARLLGLADQLGTLEAGKLADVTVVNGDPLVDRTLFDHRENVTLVLKGGRVVAGTRAPQTGA